MVVVRGIECAFYLVEDSVLTCSIYSAVDSWLMCMIMVYLR